MTGHDEVSVEQKEVRRAVSVVVVVCIVVGTVTLAVPLTHVHAILHQRLIKSEIIE